MNRLFYIVPLALFVFKDGPEVLGLAPDGGRGNDVSRMPGRIR